MSENDYLAESLMSQNEDIVDVKIYYIYKKKDNGGRIIKILEDEEGKEKIALEDTKVSSLNTKWKLSCWKEQNDLIRECQTIDPMGGVPIIDWTKYRELRVKMNLKEWDLKHNGSPVPLTDTIIDKLPPDIVVALYNKYDELSRSEDTDQGK